MKGVFLGTAELMPLMVLKASREEQNYLRSVFRNEGKMSGK